MLKTRTSIPDHRDDQRGHRRQWVRVFLPNSRESAHGERKIPQETCQNLSERRISLRLTDAKQVRPVESTVPNRCIRCCATPRRRRCEWSTRSFLPISERRPPNRLTCSQLGLSQTLSQIPRNSGSHNLNRDPNFSPDNREHSQRYSYPWTGKKRRRKYIPSLKEVSNGQK